MIYKRVNVLHVWIIPGLVHCVCACLETGACSEELIVLAQRLLSLDWLNHTKYGPLCCLVPHVGASVCLRLSPSLPQNVLTALSRPSLTNPVSAYSVYFDSYLCLSGVAKDIDSQEINFPTRKWNSWDLFGTWISLWTKLMKFSISWLCYKLTHNFCRKMHQTWRLSEICLVQRRLHMLP